MKIETKVIHAGIHPDPQTGSVMTPIYQTSTYAQSSPGVHQGYEYARTQNPTRETLENNLAALENGYGSVCFGSGLAAMDAILKTLKSGDEVVSINDVYGGSYRQLKVIFGKFGIESKFVDLSDAQNLKKHIGPKTKLIWVESPTNPMLQIVDIEAICKIAAEAGVKTCVDNTFATPFLQTPIDLGADLVLHSATKYLGGHSDVVHGVVICKTKEDHEAIKFVQNASGAVPGPLDCFLILRGIKTLHLRVQRACENAEKIAAFLQGHPKVEKVYYPGLPENPGHQIAKKQMRGFGGMVSFDLGNDDAELCRKVLEKTKYFLLAESLGGVESLIGHPASMTHGSIPKEERMKTGLTDSLIRLSVGVENIDDLIGDLEQALEVL
nr:cystathionine gamma-synthase [Saprospiraceae bacterium]